MSETKKLSGAFSDSKENKALSILEEQCEKYSAVSACRDAVIQAYRVIRSSWEEGGTLFTAGNGGSCSDAIHITGELLKAFMIKRHVPDSLAEVLNASEDGKILSRNLEPAFRVVPLGINPALRSAVDNDFKDANMCIAQELYALASHGDVLINISTSGNAKNLHYAALLAKAIGVTVIGLTGCNGGLMRNDSDIVISVPEARTPEIQAQHIQIYHALCMMLETSAEKA